MKIIAIFLIIIRHVTQIFCVESKESIIGNDWLLCVGCATENVSTMILMLFYQLGALGNNLFFVCSAWFLVDRVKFSRKKAFSFLCTVWVASLCFLVAYLSVGNYKFPLTVLVKQIFPSTFSNNWYTTCYIIFLFVYPYLNRLISIVDQKQLLRIVLFTSFLWIVATYMKSDLFFASRLILWCTIFFLIAYLKLYCKTMMVNFRIGIIFVAIGILGFIGQIVITNFAGLHIRMLNDKVMRWNNNCCPFYIMIAIGFLIIALHSHHKVHFINHISSLSLFIYLIHDNYLFKNYTLPQIWQRIYITFGYDNVVMLTLGFSVVLFWVCLLISALYRETIQRLVNNVSDKLYVLIGKAYRRVERFILEKIS